MKFEKLFESLDEKIFTPELKESLETSFNEAVELKAEVLAESKIETKINELNEQSEKHIEMLSEKSEEYIEQEKTALVESVDKYLERVVDEFVTESKDSLSQSLKDEKSDLVIEAFDSMMVATGVKVAKIVEAKDNTEDAAKLAESTSKNDALVEEVIALQSENDNLIKLGVIAEMKSTLSIVEGEKFEKLANLVEFTKDERYAEKLETIQESVKGTVVKDEKIEESVKEPSIYSHLI